MQLLEILDDFFGAHKRALALKRERDHPPELVGPVKLLSADPPVFLSGIPNDEYLGVAPAFGRRYGNVKAGFIIFPTWSIEDNKRARALRQSVLLHRQRFPKHQLYYTCNTMEEVRKLKRFRQPSLFLNHKFTVSERIFRPLPDVPVEFDAIYNARFIREKRHELAALIDKVAYLAYSEPQKARQQDFRELWAETQARCPHHVLLNVLVDGLPETQSHEDVNLALARASVGLILSAVEGANYATVEYMLAGLPVVSTPSVGGRHVFFDPDYTIVCEEDPRAVRNAVAALKERGIPRHYIRERTLQKIEPARQRFLSLLGDVVEKLGGERVDFDSWPFGEVSGVPWAPFDTHLDDYDKARMSRARRNSPPN